ncbi:unnamed protein product [Vitrella brassicaformis CCMP3155]|uniref:Uncharacterized protein n=1 Tax=Vitrella brassicaformis (strain CCMP3155) TaxID=1169540 RepID=A0A0G4H2A8_VITBC|nr:unnamed protein product [Vitrella brassicaformis CCMP3155]|eukprot:CEM37783.1 unnamed protein product [Vitrella brassicaformis CCMP3155]
MKSDHGAASTSLLGNNPLAKSIVGTILIIVISSVGAGLLAFEWGVRTAIFRGIRTCTTAAPPATEIKAAAPTPVEDSQVARIRENLPMKVWMPRDERRMMERVLTPDAVALEWGSGGSTFFISTRVKTLYSVENAAAWCDEMEKEGGHAMRTLEKAGRLVYICSNRYTPTKRLGYPEDKPKEAVKAFRAPYIEAMDTIHTFRNVTNYDVVLLDGRYRLACLLHTLKYTDTSSKLLLHDFERFKSKIAKRLNNTFDIVEETSAKHQRMGWLRKKESASFDSEEVQNMYQKAVLSPGP